MEKIGNVILDDTFYHGEDLYTDGKIEDDLLEIVKEGKQNKILYESNQWPILYHLSDIRENLLDWYFFQDNADILEIGAGCGALTGLLSRKAKTVTCVELSKKRSMINAYKNKDCNNVRIVIGNFKDIEFNKKFDYITLIGVWEYSGLYVGGDTPYIDMLQRMKELLKENGKIIVAIENKMGLKYWNGAREDHTGKFYSSINDYVGDRNVRTFSKAEIIEALKETGLCNYDFYYPMTDYKLPNTIYSEKYLPNPGNIRCYGEEYSMDRVYNFYDATVFDQLCKDPMFEYFANSFLFICGTHKLEERKVIFAQYARERCEKYRICTFITEENGERIVVKKALNESAKKHITEMKVREEKWIDALPGLCYTKGSIQSGQYRIPYIDGIALDEYLFVWRNNPREFIHQVKRILTQYLTPDESQMIPFIKTERFVEVFGKEAPEKGKSLKTTNIDLIFSNLKMTEDKRVFNYDYEWVFDFEIPYEFVIWRILEDLYNKYKIYLRQYILLEDFLEKVGINIQNASSYEKMQRSFSKYVFGINEENKYMRRYRKKVIISPNKYDYIVDFMKKITT